MHVNGGVVQGPISAPQLLLFCHLIGGLAAVDMSTEPPADVCQVREMREDSYTAHGDATADFY